MKVSLNGLRKEELILLNKNLKMENIELRSRINKLISEQERKKYLKEYSKKRQLDKEKTKR